MIYFAQAGDGGAIKIGSSRNAQRRVLSLGNAAHEDISLLGVMSGGTADEFTLHKKFAAHRIRREWFHPAPELLDFIKSHARPLESFPAAMRVESVELTGDRLREWRFRMDWKQWQAAEWFHVQLRTYQGWEAGKRRAHSDAIIKEWMARAERRKKARASTDKTLFD